MSQETYEERLQKKNNDKLNLYKNHQLELIAAELKFDEPFEVDILDPNCEDNAFNYNRGFFTIAYIRYKGQTIAKINPNFSEYGEVKFKNNKYSLEILHRFRDLFNTISYLIKDEGNGISDEEAIELDSFIKKTDFNTIQDCIDYVIRLQEKLQLEFGRFLDSTASYRKYDPNAYIRCKDKFGQELYEGDFVDVQSNGPQKIYKKEDGQLYFKPYGEESRVCEYFSNDIVKCHENGDWDVKDGVL